MKNNIIVKMKFGSCLYGTNTPNSDIDYKGVKLPSLDDILLGRISKSITDNTKKNNSDKNTSNDIDSEIYSLHYFIKLACEGQTVALDMLHCPDDMIIESSYIWDNIVKNRSKFYTKNLNAFISYARKQAAKYGIKGSRLNDAKRVLDFFNDKTHGNLISDITLRLKDIWDELPEGDHIEKHSPDNSGVRMYEVCGRKIGETSSIYYANNIVLTFYNNYGERAKKAARNEGIDWKAVSHALRAAYQVKSILTKGTIIFPLPERKIVKDVKLGKLDYVTQVSPLLELEMKKVEEMSKISTLPEKVDRKFWDQFIIDIIINEYDEFL